MTAASSECLADGSLQLRFPEYQGGGEATLSDSSTTLVYLYRAAGDELLVKRVGRSHGLTFPAVPYDVATGAWFRFRRVVPPAPAHDTDSTNWRRATEVAYVLDGDYSARPTCGDLPSDTQSHRDFLRQALKDVQSPGLQDTLGATPVDFAVMADDVEALERFTQMGYPLTTRDGTLLHGAAMFGSPALIQYLVDRNVGVNVQTAYGATPLMVAASANRLVVVRLLLVEGANPNLHVTSGEGALQYALACGYTPTVEALLDAGAVVDEKAMTIADKTGASEALRKRISTPHEGTTAP